MALAGLEAKLAEVVDAVTSAATTTSAAQAMADALGNAISDRLGGDLAMSRFAGGPVRLEPAGAEGRAELVVGGATWTLADSGRGRARGARARPRSGLRTPWGPRASVKGSTTAGFGIGSSSASDVIQAGVEAVRAEVAAL